MFYFVHLFPLKTLNSERSLEQQWSIEENGDFDEDDCA